MSDLRYRGTQEPAPEEMWWSDDSITSDEDNSEDDPTFHLNYSSYFRWSTDSSLTEVTSESESESD